VFDDDYFSVMMMVVPVPVSVMPMSVFVMPYMPLVNFNQRDSFGPAGFNRRREGIKNERQQYDNEQLFHGFWISYQITY